MQIKKIYIDLQSNKGITPDTDPAFSGSKREQKMIIKRLELLNFQVIKEFNADFEGNVYFITGDNELGKSTLLKAIGIMLTGERDDVLRNGEEKGFAKMIVGDDGENYDVELRFTKANPRGTLTIKSQTSGMKSDNVSALQRIFGYTDFDAVEFSRWSETAEGRRKQVEYVKALLPDEIQKKIASIDADIAKTKEARKDDNASLRTYTSICSAAEKELKPGDVKTYAEKIEIYDLMEEQARNAQLIEKAKTVRAALQTRTEQLDEIPARIKEADSTKESEIAAAKKVVDDAKAEYDRIVAEAKKTLESAKAKGTADEKAAADKYAETIKQIEADKADYETRKKNAADWLAKYEENNPEKSNAAEQLKQAEEHNKMYAKVLDYSEKKKQKDAAEKKVQQHETKLSKLTQERETLIANSQLPINGLTFTDDGLELNGVPFVAGKVSDSQIMEVAAKLIIASNPTVKVFRIARGESLGEKRLQSLIELAKRDGYQGFIEEVRRGQDDLVVEEYTETE